MNAMQPCSDHSLPAHSINHWPTEMARPVAVVVVVVAAFLAGLLTSEIAAEIAQNSADFYNLGRRRLPQQSLCLELIEPSGYSCSEHKVSITSLQNCPFSYLIIKFVIKWAQMLKVRCFLVFFFCRFKRKMATYWVFNACRLEVGIWEPSWVLRCCFSMDSSWWSLNFHHYILTNAK